MIVLLMIDIQYRGTNHPNLSFWKGLPNDFFFVPRRCMNKKSRLDLFTLFSEMCIKHKYLLFMLFQQLILVKV